MMKLTKALKEYIEERLEGHELWGNIRIIYSDHSIPGEGEHKILDFIWV